MPRRFVLLGLILLATMGTARAGTPVNSRLQTQVVSHGIRLSLSVGQTSYPQNALAPVTVTVRNISKKPIQVNRSGCFSPNPDVEVLNKSGAVVYPAALAPFEVPPCPFPGFQPLAPGATITRKLYAVLGGIRLRATLSLSEPTGHNGFQGVTIHTPAVRLSLTAGNTPLPRVHVSPTGASVVINPLPGPHGPLLFEDQATCASGVGGGTQVEFRFVWTRAAGHTIRPRCTPFQRWNLVAGYVGQAVASVRLGAEPVEGIALQPHSSPAVQGKAYPFQLYTHCGVDFATDFDGSFWDLADPAWAGSSGNPPRTIANPYQIGTMTLIDATHTRFDFSGGHIVFKRHIGSKIVPGLCS